MSLFDGEIAQLIGDAFNSDGVQQFTAATRIRPTLTYGTGGDITTTTAETGCLAIVSQLSEVTRQLLGFTQRQQQIIVLGTSLNPVFLTDADLTTDDQIRLDEGPWTGVVFDINKVSIDPAGATGTVNGTQA